MRRAGSGDAVALPDGGVEGVNAVVSFGLVKLDGLGVGLGDRERDFADALAHEMGARDGEQHPSDSVAAKVRMNAELGDVAALGTYAGAEHKGYEFAGSALNHHVRDLG